MADLIFFRSPTASPDLVFGEAGYIELGDFDLFFTTEPSLKNDLIFGEEQEEGAAPPVSLAEISVSLPLPRVMVEGFNIRELYFAEASIPLPSLLLRSAAIFDINTFRGFRTFARSAFLDSRQVYDSSDSGFRESRLVYEGYSLRFQEADALKDCHPMSFEEAYVVSSRTATFYEDGQPLKTFIFSSAQSGQVASNSLSLKYQQAMPLPLKISSVFFEEGVIVSNAFKAPFDAAQGVSTRFSFSTKLSTVINKSFDIFYQQAEYPVNVLPSVVPPIEPPIEPPVEPEYDAYSFDIFFDCLPPRQQKVPTHGDLIFNNCWKANPPLGVDYTEPYFVINSIELINLETGEAIQATSLDFSTDLSSFAWSGIMMVGSEEVSKLSSPTHNPVKVALSFNGNLAVFMVKTISQSVSFNKKVYKVELISPAALLDSPYSRIDSRTVTEDMAPQSLIEPMLHTDVTGLVLNWQYLSPLDWVVAANTFTYQELSPIKAIGKLLEGSAAFMYSELDGTGLTIKRKRQVEFWEGDTVPIVIESAVLTSLSFTQEKHRNFDAVYVISGLNQTLGLTAHVIREGYAGTELAPQVIAPTLTSPASVMDAGKYCLGTAGVVETRTLSQPIIEGNPLLKPADLVLFTYGGTTYVGTIISTGVSLKFNSQYQNFEVEVVKGFT